MKRLVLVACAALSLGAPAVAQTVVLVRHAEKAREPAADPPLTAEGVARSEALARSLKGAGVSVILTSPLTRTIETAAALAKDQGLQPRAVDLGADTAQHVSSVAAEVRRQGPQAVVLVVGHSNTIPAIAVALGHGEAEPMPDCEYDRLMVLRLSERAPQVVVSRYGAPSRSC